MALKSKKYPFLFLIPSLAFIGIFLLLPLGRTICMEYRLRCFSGNRQIHVMGMVLEWDAPMARRDGTALAGEALPAHTVQLTEKTVLVWFTCSMC